MAAKKFRIFVLFTFVVVTTQTRVNDRKSPKYPGEDALQNVVEHLKTHALDPASAKSQTNPGSPGLLNVETLNVYVTKSDDGVPKAQRVGEEDEDRLCKSGRCGCGAGRCGCGAGRCGCGGGRCGKEEEHDENRDEFNQLLDELEKELDSMPESVYVSADRDDSVYGSADRDDDDDDDEDDSQLRCRYGRCGRGCCGRSRYRSGDKDGEEYDALRCKYGRCGRGCCRGRSLRFEDQDEDENDALRCKYGRCGRGCCRGRSLRFEDQEEDENDALRCKYGRCGRGCCRGRSLRFEDQEEDENDALRCKYGRCGRGCCRGRSLGFEDQEEDENEALRCRYGRCRGRGRTYGFNDQNPVDNDQRGKNNLKAELERFGKKYKINEDLDAIVVDLSRFSGLLGKLSNKFMRNVKSDALNEDRASMDYLFGNTRTTDYPEDGGDVDTVVVNLGEEDSTQNLVNRIINEVLLNAKDDNDDDPLRPNDVVEYYLKQKRRLIGNALNFVKNSLGNKDIGKLSRDQKYKLQKLRSQVQKVGAKIDIKEVDKKVFNIVLGEGTKSKVLPHSEKNNNVYIPKWVHKAVKASREDLRSKRLLPLTIKQKLKQVNKNTRSYWRRNIGRNVNEYGVPFQLKIQGLGQVDP